MIDGLMGLKTKKGTVVFVCGKCGNFPESLYGAQNKDELAYLLMCAHCNKVLGEWASTEAREKELRDFAGKVKLFT